MKTKSQLRFEEIDFKEENKKEEKVKNKEHGCWKNQLEQNEF